MPTGASDSDFCNVVMYQMVFGSYIKPGPGQNLETIFTDNLSLCIGSIFMSKSETGLGSLSR